MNDRIHATHVGARSASTQVVSQPGRWSFERAPDAPPPVPAAGTLVLDPSDAALPLSRWTVALDDDVPPALHLAAPAPYAPCGLHRFAVDPSVRALVARWRLAAPAQAPAPQEFVLHGDGTLELFARPGVPRAPGRWDFARTPAPGAALEGTLALTAHPPGHAVLRDRWRVALPFARNAELEFRLADGRTVLRYRRLFR